jgi:hypothetical protein
MVIFDLEASSAIDLLARDTPRMLIIDEIRRLLSCAGEQRAAVNMIKLLSNDQPMTIIAAGTHEALMRSELIDSNGVSTPDTARNVRNT